jgi:hypothetical protein
MFGQFASTAPGNNTSATPESNIRFIFLSPVVSFIYFREIFPFVLR